MHFCVLVVVGKDRPADPADAVSPLLAPFSEHIGGDKWDWWQVGGRWTGALTPGYDPEKDPRNIKTCYLCKGTGKRTDMVVKNGCNACNGTGKAVEWPTGWAPHDGDTALVSTIPDGFLSYAVLTPDGVWHDSDDRDDVWAARFNEILKPYHDHYVVVVDCHS